MTEKVAAPLPDTDTYSTFWSVTPQELLKVLKTRPEGLTENEAQKNLELYGPNQLKPPKRSSMLNLLVAQFKSPIIIILFFAAILSFFLGDTTDSIIILVIVLVSGLLGFWQERGAADAVEKLLAVVQTKVEVLRGGVQHQLPVEEVTRGDIILLSAGDSVPGDSYLLESQDLFVDEATLTGETYPVEKKPGQIKADTPLNNRSNTLFMGTHVVSGSAKAVVVKLAPETEFGKVSERLQLRPPETEFERGIRRFGYLLLEITIVMVLGIFAINVLLSRPVLDSLLFSLALAVGLTPQLLPAIISINLARGARRMAEKKVIVKRLSSIENFGSMNVLCSDKTGTLTDGVVQISAALDVGGNESERVLFMAYLNASYESGYLNPIDQAIRAHHPFDLTEYRKLGEVPYDFIRKRLSILVEHGQTRLLVTKGALQKVLEVCTLAEVNSGSTVPLAEVKDEILKRYEALGEKGFRTLGIACREITHGESLSKEDESNMTFLGFLSLADPPKPGVSLTIEKLKQLGVSLKIITGDSRPVAAYLSQQVGLGGAQIITGQELHHMSAEALLRKVNDVSIFAEIEPNQKESIIRALKKSGNVVGYIGDGINDASALHAADVGISVDTAVDVAKEAADIVLLEKGLEVLITGVQEGRITFANTLKYVFMATSANFGNMFSMAGVSLLISFLPLLPKQILLTNLLTDFPEMTIASDNVDTEMVTQPRRWDIKFIRNFMLIFGPVSSIFDYLTFGVLLVLLKADPTLFRTGWFVESVISASMIVLVIRTRKPFYRSRPGRPLIVTTLLVAGVTLAIPYTPIADLMGFTGLPPIFLLALAVILIIYIGVAELAKRLFYRYNAR